MRVFPKVVFGFPLELCGQVVFPDGDVIDVVFRGAYEFRQQTIYISVTREENHGLGIARVLLHEFIHHIAHITQLHWLHSILHNYNHHW